MLKDREDQVINNNKDMDNGTYQVIKSRLVNHGEVLKQRIEQLNSERKSVFGTISTTLLSSERIITENNCVPRDMAPVEDCFIFGYNVHIGLKSKVEISDVFSIYRYEAGSFKQEPLDLILDKGFAKDFDDLYKYYKNTFFAKFTLLGPYLYMVFQVGKSSTDIKVFKWHIEGSQLVYVDSRSDGDIKFLGRNGFKFTIATRDYQRSGMYPHVSILDRVFVETIGGDLTIKIEDNTDSGQGIYSEDVVDQDQTLDDAEIAYVELGHLIILRILPYMEKEHRYFIYNDKLKQVLRVDSLKDTCMLLPADHGLIFPKGYYLQNGEYKIFDVPTDISVYDEKISSFNGEDFQYIFYNMESGIYLIYSYNVIQQTIDTPIVCSGYSHFKNGEMIVFKHEEEPRKNHMIQIWQTPYVDKNHVIIGKKESPLFSIGNQDIVDCMAACKIITKLIVKEESYQSIYMDIVKESQHILDSYFWIGKPEAFNLAETLSAIKETATYAIDEFEKVVRIKNSTKKQLTQVQEQGEALIEKLVYGTFDTVHLYVENLSEIRNLRGKIASLRDLQYVDLAIVEALDLKMRDKNQAFSQSCVDFIVRPEGLLPYEEQIQALIQGIETVSKSEEGKTLGEAMEKTGGDLELLMDIVSNFKIEDPTVATEIVDKISDLFSLLNNAKAKLKVKVLAFNKEEMTIQFNAQMKLLGQAVVNYLDIADTEEKCDQYLNKVMIQLQELEGKFTEFQDYLIQIDEKREAIYSAFESKKQSILDKINKRLTSLFDSAQRIISGIIKRVKALDSLEAINGYLATDLMAQKVLDIIAELRTLGDTVKADEISSTFKSLRENAIRALKDKEDLFVQGENVIKLGQHHFSVNTKAIDLSMVLKDNALYYHITGTDFWDPVVHPDLAHYGHVNQQSMVSENQQVYRGEYLAYQVFIDARENGLRTLDELARLEEKELAEYTRDFMASRYQEGYTKGVHDLDGAKLLKALITLHQNIDLLIYDGEVRAMARLFFNQLLEAPAKNVLLNRLKQLGKVSQYFEGIPSFKNYLPDIIEKMNAAFHDKAFFNNQLIPAAAEYLSKELMAQDTFVVSLKAKETVVSFKAYLKEMKATETFEASLVESSEDLEGRFYLVKEWVDAYINSSPDLGLTSRTVKEEESLLLEVVVLLMENADDLGRVVEVDTKVSLTGLVGSHDSIKPEGYVLDYTEFIYRLEHFSQVVVQDYLKFQELKKSLIEGFRNKLHLEDFKPNVLTSFVRNQLIDRVYLPLIGNNLAKQMGALGDNKRTDLMGLLLLVSPPGYGKTTLMEYVADRLGIILVKVNGPSLGNQVTSLDPEKADNSGAREELRKLNLALKMGNNVMIYVDDIQHCHPEFLQKFISLCDGQRKIEGVYNGQGQTYDLRGKKVAVVMAGNPYTESGEQFKIPDMLANRADVYNLGDMLRENEEAFKLSYIENALTSNPVLGQLASKGQKDLYSMIKLAKGAQRESLQFESEYSIDALSEYTQVLDKLFKVQDIVLKVNMAYIYSAAQGDDYRTEPAFKLQGSYRNMNKIAEKVVSVMNDAELMALIQGSYENDCQTLTTGSEANMLKWKELVGCITEAEQLRFDEIKQLFIKNRSAKGQDAMGQAVMVLSDLTEHLGSIKDLLGKQ